MTGIPSKHAQLALMAAVVAFLWGTPALSQETVVVRVKLIQGEVPTDPTAPIWNTIPGTEFPMAPQVHWQKRILQVTVWYWRNDAPGAADMSAQGFGSLKKQAQQDVQAKGIWKDEKTKVRFKERKLNPRKDAKGEPAKDPKTGDPLFDEETKVVEQDVTGVWRVVFIRALTTSDPNDAQFQPGTFPNIAFAVWDGKKLESGDLKESGSQKAVTSWWYFNAEPPTDYAIYLYGLIAVVVAAGVEYVIIRKVKKGQPA